nr:ribonuclease H-like domain-containing protein [Tanacetum cinerariifolium]
MLFGLVHLLGLLINKWLLLSLLSGKNVHANMVGDVKFFKSVLPFKDSVSKEIDTSNVLQDLNHINFFDNEYLKMPYNDERVNPKLNSDQRSQSDSSRSSMPGGNINIVDFSDDKFGNDAQAVLIFLLHKMSREAIGSKWIYKIKYKSSGQIDMYKARLVAQGFGQKE